MIIPGGSTKEQPGPWVRGPDLRKEKGPEPIVTQLVPLAFENYGYWSREDSDHTVIVGYKDEPIGTFPISENTFEAVLNGIIEHFIRATVAAASMLSEQTKIPE